MTPGQLIPGQVVAAPGDLELNAGRETIVLTVANAGDRPVQVGSHYHFAETNAALMFDRSAARGFRLDIPAGTAIRFEPGASRQVTLVAFAGDRVVHGFRGEVMGPLGGRRDDGRRDDGRRDDGRRDDGRRDDGRRDDGRRDDGRREPGEQDSRGQR